MPEHSTGWAGPHRALGLTPACGHGAMAEHINSQIMVIWLEKRIAQTSDTVVRDHLERSLGWLKRRWLLSMGATAARKELVPLQVTDFLAEVGCERARGVVFLSPRFGSGLLGAGLITACGHRDGFKARGVHQQRP